MICTHAEAMISRYLDHTLEPKELESFLRHVNGCSECYKELETSFFVRKVVEQLDDAADGDLNIRELLEEDLARSRRYVQMHRIERTLVMAGLVLGLCVLVLVLVFLINGVI